MNRKNVKKMRVWIIISLIISIAASPIYAGNLWRTDDYDLTDFSEKMEEIYSLAQKLVLAAGCIGVALGGWKCITGGQDQFQKGIQIALASVISVAVLLILPVVIRYGMDLGKEFGWKLGGR